ncbi:L-rhamnose mutarotase [Streptomyces sp. NPDC057137]|uniref:L-rhamnose mutarotase n=1 Tax=Streptomyces sp. NPDC057137 TaxID=3346030 RepID=UPI00362D7A28
MDRVCFLLKVRQERLAEYRERHTAVWPGPVCQLTSAGRRLARTLSALSASSKYVQYENDPPP